MNIYVPIDPKLVEDVNDLQNNLSAAAAGAQVYISTSDVPQVLEAAGVSADLVSISDLGQKNLITKNKAAGINLDDPGYIQNLKEQDIKLPPPLPEPPAPEQYAEYYTPPAGKETGKTEGSDQPAPTGKSYSGGGVSELNDLADYYMNELNKLKDSLNDSDYYTEEDGFLIPDAQKLQKLFEQMMGLIYMIQLLAMLADMFSNQFSLALEIMQQVQVSSAKLSAQIGSMLETDAGNLNSFIDQTFQTCLEENQNRYQTAYEESNKYNDDIDEQIEDFFTGGENSMKVMEARIKASEKYEAATQKILNGLKQVLSAMGPTAQKVVAKFDNLTVTRPNGYIDLNIEGSDGLMALRESLANANDLEMLNMEVLLESFEIAPMLMQIILEVQATSNGRGLVLKVAGEAKKNVMSIFDQVSNIYMLKKQVHNQKNYDKLQLKKLEEAQNWNIASMVATCIAIIISLIASIFTFGAATVATLALVAVAAGLTAAGTRWAGAEIADGKIDDEFIPLDQMGTYYDISDFCDKTGDQLIDNIINLDVQERKLLNKPNKEMLFETKDGYKSIDYKAFMGVVDQRSNLQLIRDLMTYLKVGEIGIVRLASQLLNGYQVGNGTKQVIDSTGESEEGGKDLSIEAAKYTLTDLKTAHNQERSQEIAMDNALNSFWISSACAVAGGILTAAAGVSLSYFSIGFGIASAIGSVVAELINAKTSEDVAYGREQEAIDYLKEIAQGKAKDSFEAMQDEYLIQLLEETKEKKGKEKTERIVNLQKLLADLEICKSLWIDTNLAAAETVKNFAYTQAGISGDSNDVGSKYQTHSNKATSQKMNFALSITREIVEVSDRADEANKAVDKAWNNFYINMGVAVAGALLGVGMAIGGAATSSIMTVFNLISPLMNLATGIYNIVFYQKESTSDFDDLENDFNNARKLRQSQSKTSGLSVTDNLDQVELNIIGEVTKKMLSKYGLNSGFFGNFQTRASRLYEIKQAVYKMIDLEAEQIAKVAQEWSGYGAGGKRMIQKAGGQQRTLMFSGIENILRQMREMGSQLRKMERSDLMMIKSIISTSLAAVQLVMSAVQTSRNEERLELKQNEQLTAVQENRLNYLNEVSGFWEPLQLMVNSLRILNTFIGIIATAAYNDIHEDEGAEAPTEVEGPDKGERGLGASLDRLEAQKTKSGISSGRSLLETERIVEYADFMRDILNSLHSFIKDGINYAGSIVKDYQQKQKLENMASSGYVKGEAEAAQKVQAKLQLARERARKAEQKTLAAKKQVKTLQDKLVAAKKNLQKLNNVAQLAQQKAGQLKATAKTPQEIRTAQQAEAAAQQAQAKLAAAQELLSATQASVEQAEQTVNVLEKELGAVLAEVKQLDQEAQIKEERLERLNKMTPLEQAREGLREAQEKVLQAKHKLVRVRKRLIPEQKNNMEQQKVLQTKAKKTKDDEIALGKLQARATQIKAGIDSATAEFKQAQNDLKKAQSVIDEVLGRAGENDQQKSAQQKEAREKEAAKRAKKVVVQEQIRREIPVASLQDHSPRALFNSRERDERLLFRAQAQATKISKTDASLC